MAARPSSAGVRVKIRESEHRRRCGETGGEILRRDAQLLEALVATHRCAPRCSGVYDTEARKCGRRHLTEFVLIETGFARRARNQDPVPVAAS